MIKVLAAPAAYILSDRVGSEPYISYALLSSLASNFDVKFYAIVNRVDLDQQIHPNIKVIKANVNLNGGLVENVAFLLQYGRISVKVLRKEGISLIHHILPSGSGFNPLSLLKLTEKYPFIMGPVQCPQTFSFEDERLLAGRASWSLLRRKWTFEFVLESLLLESASPILKIVADKTLNDCDVLVAVNEEAKNLYAKYVDATKIEVIPFGVDTNQFSYHIPPDNHDVLALGGLFKRKGFDFLIKAMNKVVKESPDARLHIVGDGPQRGSLMKLAKELNLEKHVIFHGFIPLRKVPEFYRMCRVMCSPSLSESFGRVIIEAMASGRPVIATGTIGARGIIKHGRTGFLVPIADSKALANALLKVLSDYDLACKMGLEGRREAEEKYDWKVIAQRYYEIYESLIS